MTSERQRGLVDRAVGVLLGSAAGDALGAGYEFETAPLPPDGRPQMIGGGLGGFAPGEWTDDTAQTYAIARVAATGADLRTEEALDAVAAGFVEWYAGGPADIGNQTRAVLSAVEGEPTAAALTQAARRLHERTGHTAGNGSLMRTSAVALAHLDHPEALTEAAVRVSELTHADPLAGEACVLWCQAIRSTVRAGELPDLHDGLAHLPASRRDEWRTWIDEAETRPPEAFNPNGYVVSALQAAWSAIVHVPDAGLVEGLGAAIRIGNDTDTVAAIAGALLGARWGASAVPTGWRDLLHGWPGARADDLVELATAAVGRG